MWKALRHEGEPIGRDLGVLAAKNVGV